MHPRVRWVPVDWQWRSMRERRRSGEEEVGERKTGRGPHPQVERGWPGVAKATSTVLYPTNTSAGPDKQRVWITGDESSHDIACPATCPSTETEMRPFPAHWVVHRRPAVHKHPSENNKL